MFIYTSRQKQVKVNFFQKEKSRKEINITPLIDIVFLMLVFFMLVSKFDSHKTIEINIPTKTPDTTPKKEDFLVIELMEKNILKIENTLIQNKNLASEIKNIKKTRPVNQVLIIGKTNSKIKTTVSIMDEIRSIGIKNIAIKTKP